MGEMADYYLEQDIGDEAFYEPAPQNIMCRYCKKWNFHWALTKELKWRLHTPSGKVHVCSAHPATQHPLQNRS